MTENNAPKQDSKSDSSTNGSSAQDSSSITSQLPVDRLMQEAQKFGMALMEGGFSKAEGKVGDLTSKLKDVGSGGGVAAKAVGNIVQGDSPVKGAAKAGASEAKDKVTDKAKDAIGKVFGKGGGGGDGKKIKVTNIVEEIDVPVPRSVAYNQWTQFEDFSGFMKKVESVTQESDEKMKWQAKIFWSKRTWEAEIIEQVPDEKIIWKSTGEKGHVNGAVTFHELSPDLTRILMVLEYHPGGLFEHTGNIWRAQGRRARLELKHFRRHVSVHTLLTDEQEALEGWRGEIKDGEVQEDSTSEEDESSQEDSSSEDEGSSQEDSSSEEEGSSEEEASSDSAEDKKPVAKKSRSSDRAKKSTSSTAKKSSSGQSKKSTSSAAKKSTSGTRNKKAAKAGSSKSSSK